MLIDYFIDDCALALSSRLCFSHSPPRRAALSAYTAVWSGVWSTCRHAPAHPPPRTHSYSYMCSLLVRLRMCARVLRAVVRRGGGGAALVRLAAAGRRARASHAAAAQVPQRAAPSPARAALPQVPAAPQSRYVPTTAHPFSLSLALALPPSPFPSTRTGSGTGTGARLLLACGRAAHCPLVDEDVASEARPCYLLSRSSCILRAHH